MKKTKKQILDEYIDRKVKKILSESYIWTRIGDEKDIIHMTKIVDNIKNIYKFIKPENVDIEDFETELDGMLRGNTESDSLKLINDFMKLYPISKMNSTWKKHFDALRNSLIHLLEVIKDAQNGNTSRHGYKIHKNNTIKKNNSGLPFDDEHDFDFLQD